MPEYPETPECMALDPGTENLRFAYVNDLGRPEPSIVTDIMSWYF